MNNTRLKILDVADDLVQRVGLNAMLLEENGEGDVVIFDLESGEFVEDCGTDLRIQLRGRFDLLLLRLQLLLECLDFRLQREDLILLRLDALLDPAVSDC